MGHQFYLRFHKTEINNFKKNKKFRNITVPEFHHCVHDDSNNNHHHDDGGGDGDDVHLPHVFSKE